MDNEKRNKIVGENTGLVYYLAGIAWKNISAKAKSITSGYNVTYYDLVSAGMEGLIIAADKYDESKGNLSPYAGFYIKEKIYEEIKKAQEPFVANRSYKKKEMIKRNIRIELDKEKQKNPNNVLTDKELAKKLNLSQKTIKNLLHEMNNQVKIVSMDELDYSHTGDIIGGYACEMDLRDRDRLYAAMDELDGEQLKIVNMAYGLNGYERTKRRDIAKKLDMTTMEVSNILANALDVLKQKLDG